MIGLGSNRLTCCRRGGMSVTQAGRGGMEWLAGWREPSWASPYSAQATAALKAQFPTQWPTIRDYGFAHPALVPFINEDPMLVMSLIEGLGTRWLVGDGASWIRTSFYPTATDIVKATIIPLDVPNSGCPYGARNKSTGNGPGSYNDFWTNRVRIDWAASLSTDVFVGSVTNGTIYHVEEKKGYFKLNGTVLYNQTVQNETLNYPLFIFANNNADVSVQACMKAKISELSCYGKCNFVPFVSTTRNGMLDIHDLKNPVFYPNAGTGTFTTSESPS